MNNKKKIGSLGEDISAKYLQKNNYEVINRNYSCKFGEIDIIAIDKNTKELVFIEVKTRTNFKYGMPIDAIDIKKIKHIKNTINYYLIDKKVNNIDIRIDVIQILLKGKKYYINHIKQII